jgi:hypothetical protein
METPYIHELPAARARREARAAQAVSLLGPVTAAAGLIWAILQPYRVTLLHPRGQGVWWLLVEPPLLVAAAGLAFALIVARPLLTDLEKRDAAAR